MIELTVYDPVTGRILRNLTIPEWDAIEFVAANIGDGEEAVEGLFSSSEYVIRNGEPVSIPPQTSETTIFDHATGQWVDERTAADWSEALQAARDTASLSRAAFILACVPVILNPAEARIAAAGDFPEPFAAILATMPAEQQLEAEIRWRAATVIDRTNPLIVNMAAAANIDEWTLDEVFGVIWPPPLPDWPAEQLHP